MNKFKKKYFYFFRGNLRTHIQFFKAFRDASDKSGIPMKLITFLGLKTYFKQQDFVNKYRDKNFSIYPAIFPDLFAVFYFFVVSIFSAKVIIHLKKRDPKYLFYLKKLFRKKIVLIIDLEGDILSERDYLLENPYRPNFYYNEILSLNEGIKNEKIIFEKVDKIIVLNNTFKELLLNRYHDLSDKIIVAHSMSFRKGSLQFDATTRKEYRKRIGWDKNHIVCYIGNVHYSWQNISKTIVLFKRIQNELFTDAKLLLLIKVVDHNIACSFLNKHQIKSSDFILKEVAYEEIKNYLSASDLGVLLRDFHIMNSIVTSGKLSDYLGCGLPVITTSILNKISAEIRKQNFGIVLDDLDINKANIKGLREIMNFDSYKRKAISAWANKNLCIETTIDEYINVLKQLGH